MGAQLFHKLSRHPGGWMPFTTALFVSAVIPRQEIKAEGYPVCCLSIPSYLYLHGKTRNVYLGVWEHVIIRSPSPKIEKFSPVNYILDTIYINKKLVAFDGAMGGDAHRYSATFFWGNVFTPLIGEIPLIGDFVKQPNICMVYHISRWRIASIGPVNRKAPQINVSGFYVTVGSAIEDDVDESALSGDECSFGYAGRLASGIGCIFGGARGSIRRSVSTQQNPTLKNRDDNKKCGCQSKDGGKDIDRLAPSRSPQRVPPGFGYVLIGAVVLGILLGALAIGLLLWLI